MNNFGITVVIILAVAYSAMSTNLNCNYMIDEFTPVGPQYVCLALDTIVITSSEEAVITSVNGTHLSDKTDDDVLGVYFVNVKVFYIPQRLEIFFKNIIGLIVGISGLKQINQDDFQNYENLKLLALYDNNIKVIGEGIFNNNPGLIFINLDRNNIAEVHPNVFDDLKNLTTLLLGQNVCINDRAENNATAVQNLIQQVRLQCPSPISTTTVTSTTEAETTTDPGDNECPESCLSRINELEERLNNFINETAVRLDRFESILSGKIGNFEKILEKVMKALNI